MMVLVGGDEEREGNEMRAEGGIQVDAAQRSAAVSLPACLLNKLMELGRHAPLSVHRLPGTS